jgi:hypothetical protein
MKEVTDEELIELISKLAMIDATGETNGVPRLGLAGAEEALVMMIDFFTEEEGK